MNLNRALSVESSVLTPTGWIKAVDVSVGDTLISQDGSHTRVLGVYPQPAQPLWRVVLSDGSSAQVTGDHWWAVTTKHYRIGRGKPRSGRGGKPYRPLQLVTTSDICERLERRGSAKWSLPLLSAPAQFPAQSVPLDPYLLGLLLGDGCFTPPSVRLITADQELVDRVSTALPAGVEIGHQGRYAYVLRGGHPNPVIGAIRDLGLVGYRAWEKFVPARYLWNSPEVRLAVLQGLMDTDGHVDHGQRLFTTTSKALAEDVVFLAQSLGGTATVRVHTTFPRPPRRPAYRMGLRLPHDFAAFRLTRKQSVARRYQGIRNAPRRYIVGVEPAGHGPAVCFRVDHPSGLFVINDFIVTHNTTIPTFEEQAQKGLPIEFREGRTEAIIRWGARPAVHFFFFGMDRRADADKFQGFTSGVLWLEEVAPAADLATGIPAETLGIGVGSVRQAGIPPRVIVTLNPPDPDHWILKIEKALAELGRPEIEVYKLMIAPGEKARHFRELAAEATDPEEAHEWEEAARAFEAYRVRGQSILELLRPDLAARLFGGEVRGITLGERVVPEFSRKLHVSAEPLVIRREWPIWRGWDAGLCPSAVWAQPVPGGAGINILGSRTAVNMGMAQMILYDVTPFQERYGLVPARRRSTGYRGSTGGYEFSDVGDPQMTYAAEQANSEATVARTVENMLGTTMIPGVRTWSARREALHVAFIRKGVGDRMFVQIDPDENDMLIQALDSKCVYPVDPATGRINESVEAMKKSSGLFHNVLDALSYLLAHLYPAEEWLKRAVVAPPPKTPRPQSWLGA